MKILKVLMDSDCLIKITKASLKELVTEHFHVVIPSVVKKEVVQVGMARQCPDAFIVDENIKKKKIDIVESETVFSKGDEALLTLFHSKKFDAVATDDAKLIRKLKIKNIPFILPALFIYKMAEKHIIHKRLAFEYLQGLQSCISDDEGVMVHVLLENFYERHIH